MLNELREHQHEIGTIDGSYNILFGTEDTGYLTLTRPTTEGAEQRVGDRDRPGEDGRVFGRDFRTAKTVVFEIGVITDHLSYDAHRANLDYLDRLEGFWVDEQWREDPTAFAMLRSHEAGQTWRCYGRPRRYEPADGKLTELGFTPVIADFPMVDNQWYADTESVALIGLLSGSQGGLKAPLKAPLSTTQASSGAGSLTVGGSRATWPVVEFHGPITNPEVTIGNVLRVGITGTLAYDEVIVFDPRPWQRRVYRQSDGAGMGGKVSAATPVMKKAKLPPGAYTLTYTGLDITGTSTCTIRWRNARSRP